MHKQMNVKEAAAFLGIYPGSLYRYVRKGAVPHYRVGSRIFFQEKTLIEWIRRQEENG